MLRKATRNALLFAARTADRLFRLSVYLAVSTFQFAELRHAIAHEWKVWNADDVDATSGLSYWEQEIVDRFVPPTASVLVVGSGSGRDVLPLVARGCQVTGVEPVSSAVAFNEKLLSDRGLNARLITAFFEDASISGSFDVVIFSTFCYALIPESHRRVRALAKAATLLKPGGRILISYPARTPRPRPFFIKAARLMSTMCGSDWHLEDGDHVWSSPPRVFYVHSYERRELEQEAAAVGVRPSFWKEWIDEAVVALERP